MNSMELSENEKSINSFSRLQQIVKVLRGDHGCPWDIKQTPASLKKYLLEECNELAEAIDKGQHEAICEEIGDLFYILTLLITMFEEQQQFTADNVFGQIIQKMIRRHPHVFSGTVITSDEELRAQWARIKSLEKVKATTHLS